MWYFVYMKAIQITMDDALLAQLDADPDVKREGRSAVLRRAVAEYLRQRRKRQIAEQYAKAYKNGNDRCEDFAGWEAEAVWPDE